MLMVVGGLLWSWKSQWKYSSVQSVRTYYSLAYCYSDTAIVRSLMWRPYKRKWCHRGPLQTLMTVSRSIGMFEYKVRQHCFFMHLSILWFIYIYIYIYIYVETLFKAWPCYPPWDYTAVDMWSHNPRSQKVVSFHSPWTGTVVAPNGQKDAGQTNTAWQGKGEGSFARGVHYRQSANCAKSCSSQLY